MTEIVKITAIQPITHDVHRYTTTKPEGYEFTPGQACELNLAKDGWRDEKRPFTFTCLPEHDYLEFTIKHYADHDGVTKELAECLVGDEFEITEAWGTIEYEGPGTFIAGGAGITPFIAILRHLKANGNLADHRLIFANKQERDIIIREELEGKMPGLEVIHILSQDEEKSQFEHGRVDQAVLKRHIDDFSQHFYVCGPEPMQDSVMSDLKSLGADPDGLVFEK